jgi:2-polyprenyl-6-hydroxyphenyl methylase/3-demethylubiquinone-9 3-methyltransferase
MKFPAIRPASTTPQPCKICGGEASLYGLVDFNKSCGEQRGVRLPLAGIPVYYRRCRACDFLFTDAFDDWSIEEFRAHIYNDDYAIVDPDYAATRPRDNAGLIEKFWGELRGNIRVLDFGGGNDMLCSALRAKGFATALTYDPMVQGYARRPEGKFDLVTCFETIEHMPDPVAGIAAIVDCAADPGLIFYSTVVQPDDISSFGLAWWYVGPRNGHVSIFSRQSLAAIWARFGYKTVSFNYATHFAFRTLPPYLAQLQGQADGLGNANGPLAA